MADRWVKLNTNWMDSEWLIVLSAESRLAWVQIICYTKAHGMSGRVKAKTPAVFGRQNFLGEESVAQVLKAAELHGAMYTEDGEWVLTGWQKHQGDETGAERQKRYRDRRNKTEEVLTRDGFKCVACGASEDLEVDHIIPVSLGGDTSMSNLQTLCQTCNKKKGGRIVTNGGNALRRDCNAEEKRREEKKGEERRQENNKKPAKGKRTWDMVAEELIEKLPHHDPDSLRTWCEYKRQLGGTPLVPIGLTSFVNKHKDWTRARMNAAIETSMARGWSGVYEGQKTDQPKPKPQPVYAEPEEAI